VLPNPVGEFDGTRNTIECYADQFLISKRFLYRISINSEQRVCTQTLPPLTLIGLFDTKPRGKRK